MNFIEHIIEPTRLLLAWQAQDGHGSRKRHIVAELVHRQSCVELRYLTNATDFAEAERLGFDGYPAFNKRTALHANQVVETFMRRLPPRTRKDFSQYLENFRLPPDAKLSNFALLGYTGANLPRDGFSIVNPFDNVAGPCELLLEVAGLRYREDVRVEEIHIDDPVAFCEDPQNNVDPSAIQIYSRDRFIGYVVRGQTEAVHRWMHSADITATVERINGDEKRPLVFVFFKVRPRCGGSIADALAKAAQSS